MTSHDLMNINSEADKYTCSVAPSRSKWRLIDIIAINYIIYTHNFKLMENQETLLFNHMLPVKIHPDFPKPWQVEHEINNKISITFFAKFLPTSCC